jgi:trk system potassium uptake protein
MAHKEFGVVGLGKFGLSLASSLMAHGQKVVGVDSDPDKVKAAAEVLTQAYQAEAVDKTALEQLGFGELQEVIVSTGRHMEASILITLFLKELGCKNVTVKALSRDHEKVLTKVGADAVIFPERYAAEQLAAKLAVPGLIDYLPLGTNVILKELTVETVGGEDPARAEPDQFVRHPGGGGEDSGREAVRVRAQGRHALAKRGCPGSYRQGGETSGTGVLMGWVLVVEEVDRMDAMNRMDLMGR